MAPLSPVHAMAAQPPEAEGASASGDKDGNTKSYENSFEALSGYPFPPF